MNNPNSLLSHLKACHFKLCCWIKGMHCLAGFIGLLLTSGCATQRERPSYPDLVAPSPTGDIVVIGDTQQTLFTEYFLLGREQNESVPPMLMDDVVARRPMALVHLGDCVGSATQSAWRQFDEWMSGVRAAGIPVLPAPGNHDYWKGRKAMETEFCGRFAALDKKQHWFSRRAGRLLLIVLDSNIKELAPVEWENQKKWFQAQVNAADADEAIAGVVVFVHHPPYTNSRVTSDAKQVQDAFITPFVAHAKTMVLFGGHTHAYEHFLVENKTFLVCGGGGGPRVNLLEGKERRHVDLYTGHSPRPFHYVLLHEIKEGIQVTVCGMNKGDKESTVMEQFILPFK